MATAFHHPRNCRHTIRWNFGTTVLTVPNTPYFGAGDIPAAGLSRDLKLSDVQAELLT